MYIIVKFNVRTQKCFQFEYAYLKYFGCEILSLLNKKKGQIRPRLFEFLSYASACINIFNVIHCTVKVFNMHS